MAVGTSRAAVTALRSLTAARTQHKASIKNRRLALQMEKRLATSPGLSGGSASGAAQKGKKVSRLKLPSDQGPPIHILFSSPTEEHQAASGSTHLQYRRRARPRRSGRSARGQSSEAASEAAAAGPAAAEAEATAAAAAAARDEEEEEPAESQEPDPGGGQEAAVEPPKGPENQKTQTGRPEEAANGNSSQAHPFITAILVWSAKNGETFLFKPPNRSRTCHRNGLAH